MSTVWEMRHQIDKARHDKMREAMDEYDRTVYHPAKRELFRLCLDKHGSHAQSKYHDNGLGWSWWYCGRCGAKHGEQKHS